MMEQGFVGMAQESETTVHNSNISTGGTANTKGSWVEVIASTTFDYDCILIHAYDFDDQDSYLIDIAIGGSGNEEIIVPNLSYQCPQTQGGDDAAETPYFFPIVVPAGTRIAARGQCEITNEKFRIAITGFKGQFEGLPKGSHVLAHNVNTSTSRHTNNAGGTVGVWKELVASLAEDALGYCVSFHSSNASNEWADNTINRCDLGIGVASSEEAIASFLIGGEDGNIPMSTGYLPMPIPSGSRLSYSRAADLAGASGSWAAFLYTVH